MSIQNCPGVVVRGDAINYVKGNQVNQTISAQFVHINSQGKTERTEYDEFEEVKRGNVKTLMRLRTEGVSEWEYDRKDGKWVKTRSGQRTICTVEVQQCKYTAAIYEGKDAETFWKKDFDYYSRAGLGKPEIWQLYGLNRSKIPFLIFHGELVPLKHDYKKLIWVNIFVVRLEIQSDCPSSYIWLDTRGNLCKGLKGPCVVTSVIDILSSIIVPSFTQFLQAQHKIAKYVTQIFDR